MAVTTTKTNKPLNPRGNDQSPKGYNRAELYTGKALDFDGVNDYIDLYGFTMAGDVATIVFQAKFSNDQYLLDINIDRFVIRNRATDGFSVFNTTAWTSYGDTLRDELGFYAIVSDGTKQRVYYNGHQLGSEQTVTALDWDSITKFKIASNNTGTNNFFDGQLSGFKIFNTALTAAQVADLYNNPEKIVPTGVADSALKLWLPMQEGAGTTAYDGSGNGNHGTISGATWTHGIGAPVAQTAVIDWNKGTNLFEYSEQFNQASWTKFSSTLTSGQTAPDGSDNAYKIVFSDPNAYIQNTTGGLDTSSEYTISCWVKSDGADTDFRIGNISAGSFETRTATSEWQRFEVTQTPSGPTRYPRPVHPITGSETLYIWGAQLEKVSSAGAYIPNHTGTQITSDVLLPQGLTTGRDITGVNLFENVRKQGALNLDGNSWAEVHDNASTDMTEAITLECWIYYDGSRSDEGVFGKWFPNTERAYMIYATSNQIRFYINTSSSSHVLSSVGWYHIVGTYDKVNRKLYINGTEEVSTAYTSTIALTAKPVEIGRYYGGSSTNAYNGAIAQPRIYNRALTAEEVERNYNAGKNIYK